MEDEDEEPPAAPSAAAADNDFDEVEVREGLEQKRRLEKEILELTLRKDKLQNKMNPTLERMRQGMRKKIKEFDDQIAIGEDGLKEKKIVQVRKKNESTVRQRQAHSLVKRLGDKVKWKREKIKRLQKEEQCLREKQQRAMVDLAHKEKVAKDEDRRDQSIIDEEEKQVKDLKQERDQEVTQLEQLKSNWR